MPSVSRRNFLKILGASSAVGAAGCADNVTETIFPNVKGDTETIPGVAAWFRSTCDECSSGCGIEVRTRDGRAVKIEGNPNHPVNRGGLCALGHSALQGHYDPDRVRQPLLRDASNGTFKPITWDEAYQKISDRLSGTGAKKRLFLSGETSGALAELSAEFCNVFSCERATFDLLQPVALAKASEMTFGIYGIPAYSIDKAEVVVNFGADFLETWVSPCEYARDWATTRKSERPARVVQIEPRLSLTGANADMWLAADPGSEIQIALFLLKSALDSGRGANLRDDLRESARALVAKVSVDSAASASGVSKEKILLVANYLLNAKSTLVLAGGAAAASSDPLPLFIVVNLLNMALGNLGTTVNIAERRVPRSSVADMLKAIEAMQSDAVELVFIHRTNPAFSLPSSYGFSEALKRVPLTVSLSSHLDETTSLADLVLPINSPLESWGDSNPTPGVHSLLQPAMSALWDTRMTGDIILQISAMAAKGKVADGAANFEEYLKSRWSKLYSSLSRDSSQAESGDNFAAFWRKSVERGGYFAAPTTEVIPGSKVTVDTASFGAKFASATFDAKDVVSDRSLILMPFPAVKSFDGRAANRPWMMEVPDPMSQTVWDAWAEIHPKTAHRLGLAKGDLVTLRNFYGEVNVPIYLTDHVHHDVVAVPMGYGHTAGGRYAQQIQGANVLTLLPPVKSGSAAGASGAVPLLSTRVTVLRGPGRAELVNVMGSDSQLGRELARTTMISGAAVNHDSDHHDSSHGHAAHGGHGDHGEVKQMYHQREHPLFRWGMAVDLSACTGCSACVVACYSENNIPVVGKDAQSKGREMSWLRIERYFDPVKGEDGAQEFQVSFLPMMCQHCGNAPCEPVCPVFATYHNDEGLNAMVYNRCVGTRYCSNNCSYKVRRFNWYEYDLPEPMKLMLNPDVTKRSVGVMEKCTFCVQRISEAKDHAKDEGRMVRDGEVQPACVQSCPTQALAFGNLNDPESKVSKLAAGDRAYKVLDHHLNTQPAISYMNRVRYEA